MPPARKPRTTSNSFDRASVAKAIAAAPVNEPDDDVDWSRATVSRGGGVAGTIDAVRRGRGPNKNPTKEQVAIRLDRSVLAAFRAGGAGWQTRLNAALKEWIAAHEPALPAAPGKRRR